MDFQPEIIARALPSLLEGSLVTIKITLISFVLSIIIGFTVGLSRSLSKTLHYLFLPYVELFRGTPLLIQLFFIYYGLPTAGITLTSFQAAIVGLGMNGGAYISEVIRGALASVDSGQQDAAFASGLNRFQTILYIVLPQALAVAIPPLTNVFAGLLKESSLVSVLAITELTRVGQLIYTRNFRAFEIYMVIGLLYLFMTLSVVKISHYLEKRFSIKGRCC